MPMKNRFLANPFDQLSISKADRARLEDLANDCITSNLELYTKFISNKRRTVDPNRWKLIKEGENLKVFSERLGRAPVTGDNELTGSGLPMLLCVGTMEGNLDDLMFGVTSEDLETMRIKASYVDDVSKAAALEDLVLPTEEKPFQSLVLKWMEIDIPFCSTNLVKNRDYVYLEGTGYVMNSRGERIGYHLLHSVAFRQTRVLPNRVRGNLSNITFWRQNGSNTMETYATSIMDPVDIGFIRKLVVPTMANTLLSSLKYVHCGQMRKLTFMLDRKYAESKMRGVQSKVRVCTTCTAPVTNRRFSDFSRTSSTCKLCFGFVCSGCKIVRKLSFVDLDMQLTQCKRLVIKWMTIDVPLLQSTNLVKSRDFVYIEATGAPNRDRVGYHLLRSIEFRQTKPLPHKIRGSLSIFGFFRQIGHNVIDNYAGGTMDPGGDIQRFLLIPVAAGALLSATTYVYCGQMKKLSWMLQRLHSSQHQRLFHPNDREACVMCAKKANSSFLGPIGWSSCKLCHGCVCYSCNIHKRISFIALDGQLIQRKISFCAKCVTEATKWNALEPARDQAVGYEAYKAFLIASHSDESELSLCE